MGRVISVLLSIIGIFVAVVGFNADRLFGGNPGISTSQLLLIVSGVVVAIIGVLLLIDRVRQQLVANWGKLVGITLPTSLFLLVMLEIALRIVGAPTLYPTDAPPEGYYEPADWWVCDDLGCHFDTDERIAVCEQFDLGGRTCDLNAQGFRDDEDFVVTETLEEAPLRILMLGDSFTFGASASAGNSFVEVLEANSEAVVWNVSMPGSGTVQHVQWLETFAPLMQPDLVIIGFFENDYQDNLFPIDSYFFGTPADGRWLAIRQYAGAEVGELRRVDSPEALYYRAYGVAYPENAFVRALGQTRVGSVVLRFWNTVLLVRDRPSDNWIEQPTREYLEQVRAYADEFDLPILILGIPSLQDVDDIPSLPIYDASLDLFEETGLEVLDARLFITTEHFNPPDVHWNTQGHIIVGQQLAACAESYQRTQSIAECISAFEEPVIGTQQSSD